MGLVAHSSSYWCLLEILALLATRVSGWSYVTSEGNVQIASPVTVQPAAASQDPAIGLARSGASEPKWKLRVDGSDNLLINMLNGGVHTETVKFDPAAAPTTGTFGVTISESMKVTNQVDLQNLLVVGGDTTLKGHLAMSTNGNVDVSSAAHTVDDTFTVIAVASGTNQVNLPQTAVEGRLFIVCNKYSTEAKVGTASGMMIVDGDVANSTVTLAAYQCRQFISDATTYYVVGGSSSSGDDDLTVTGDIAANDLTQVKRIFHQQTGKVIIGAGEVEIGGQNSFTTVKGSLQVNTDAQIAGKIKIDGDIEAGSSNTAPKIFTSDSSKVTVGSGDLDLSYASHTTTVLGNMQVDQNTTLTGDTEIKGDITLSSNNGIDLSSGNHAVDKTLNFIDTAHGTNQITLPTPVAGKVIHVCNTAMNNIQDVTVVSSTTNIVDGHLPVSSTKIRPFQCRQFVSDGVRWAAVTGGHLSLNSLEVVGAKTHFSGDLEIAGGDITAVVASWPVNVFATTTGKVTLGAGEVEIAGQITSGNGIVSGVTTSDVPVFSTTTGKVTLGGGDIDMSASGSVTKVKGTLDVEGQFRGSFQENIDVSAGDVAVTKMMNTISTASATYYIDLPNPTSVAFGTGIYSDPSPGQHLIVCNNDATQSQNIKASFGGLVDGMQDNPVTTVHPSCCTLFVSSGTKWFAINTYRPHFHEVEVQQEVKVNGVKVLGTQQGKIDQITNALPATISATYDQNEVGSIKGVVHLLQFYFNDLITKLEGHGILSST